MEVPMWRGKRRRKMDEQTEKAPEARTDARCSGNQYSNSNSKVFLGETKIVLMYRLWNKQYA